MALEKRLPLWLGNGIEVVGVIIGSILLISVQTGIPQLLSLILLVVSWMCFWFFPHCLTHYIVGRIVGIRFSHYVIADSAIEKLDIPVASWLVSAIPVLGIRVREIGFDGVSPTGRKAMFYSGTFASIFFPLIVVFYAVAYTSTLLTVLVAALTLGNGVFTLYFSPKCGDIDRSRRIRNGVS